MDKKRNISLILLFAVAVIWSFGYMTTKIALNAGGTSGLINLIRFSVATILFGLIFRKKITFTRDGITFGVVGGALLFLGFTLQTLGLKYTTTSNNAFFTSANIIFVPFIAWIFYKQRPNWITFVGVALAVVGLAVLSFGSQPSTSQSPFEGDHSLGNLLSLASAIAYGFQIVLTSYALNNKDADTFQLTFVQFAVAAVLFAVYFLIFDCTAEKLSQIDWSTFGWCVTFLALLNTAFAYTAQIYAQQHLPPTQVSLVLSLESFLGAVFPIAFGMDQFTWSILVGGICLCAAIFLVNYLSEKIFPNGKV